MTIATAITYKPPFPYFGGKSRIAGEAWKRFGAVKNYVEPFFGSGACLFLRPEPFDGVETVNDADGLVSNFWRAVQADPDAVARHADWPVIENDLHARHAWLVGVKDALQSRLEGDPDYYDAKIAGWWCWALCCWIGGEFASGRGPWRVVNVDGAAHLMRTGDAGRGVNRRSQDLREYIQSISDRLRRVRVCCGDWSRVCTKTPTIKKGLTAVFLDPPYSDSAGRDPGIYTVDSLCVAHDVRRWAIEHGDDPLLRIALCGYEGEHDMPGSWECMAWKTKGGYASIGRARAGNKLRERIWFSPHCLKPTHNHEDI